MEHYSPLISTIVIGIGVAFILGAIANRLRVSPLVGYLLAGVITGPYTPGFVADQTLAPQLAEIGVILLMFGVGLHFSVGELLTVRAIAIPGAIAQIAVATLLGMALAWILGWSIAAGLVFGLALSVASTVVLLRALQERHLVETPRGRIAVGWLIVEDLAMVLALVLLPSIADLLNSAGTSAAGMSEVATAVAITLGKVAAFVAVMLLVGRRLIPWILHQIAHTGSRELFRLCVLAIALGVAYGAVEIFGVSFALGAFFAGMVMSESALSQQAANETLPLRDAFAVLFFVSVGMLFDPMVVLRDPWALLATFLIIVIGKSAAAYLIVRAFGHSVGTALTISASLAQIGEFSFILAGLGVALAILPEHGRDLILAGSMLTILLNPALFALLDRFGPRVEARGKLAGGPDEAPDAAVEPLTPTTLGGHAVIVGYGRVGQRVADALSRAGRRFLIIEARREAAEEARVRGHEALYGNALEADIRTAANMAGATRLYIAIPDAFEAGQIIEQARALNTALKIVARAHSDAEVDHLKGFDADVIIMGEDQIARAMIEFEMYGTVPEPSTAPEPAPAPGPAA